MNRRKLFVGVVGCLVALSGCSASKLDSEGEQFVSGIIDGQKQHWDATKLAASMDPASGASSADVEKVFKMYSDVVGPIQSVGTITRTNFQSSVGVGVPGYKGEYFAKLTCAKGPATVDVTAVHRDGKWTIYGFNVKSDAFKNLNQAERAGAQQFVDQVSKQICNSWNTDALMDNADPDFATDMKKQSLVMKGLFLTSEKTLGAFKGYSPARYFNLKPFKGKTLYEYVAQEQFEKGQATLQYAVVKSGEGWKISGFHLQSTVGAKSK